MSVRALFFLSVAAGLWGACLVLIPTLSGEGAIVSAASVAHAVAARWFDCLIAFAGSYAFVAIFLSGIAFSASLRRVTKALARLAARPPGQPVLLEDWRMAIRSSAIAAISDRLMAVAPPVGAPDSAACLVVTTPFNAGVAHDEILGYYLRRLSALQFWSMLAVLGVASIFYAFATPGIVDYLARELQGWVPLSAFAGILIALAGSMSWIDIGADALIAAIAQLPVQHAAAQALEDLARSLRGGWQEPFAVAEAAGATIGRELEKFTAQLLDLTDRHHLALTASIGHGLQSAIEPLPQELAHVAAEAARTHLDRATGAIEAAFKTLTDDLRDRTAQIGQALNGHAAAQSAEILTLARETMTLVNSDSARILEQLRANAASFPVADVTAALDRHNAIGLRTNALLEQLIELLGPAGGMLRPAAIESSAQDPGMRGASTQAALAALMPELDAAILRQELASLQGDYDLGVNPDDDDSGGEPRR